ncbi:tetratricopeptide repeat protein [Streptomyces sp. NPDC085596]|uniref:tetratricopeptide repeat protein n=1 Tax=Streptomyces sp. NPDC085596 TaxID=3365731 RepID=UPI0037D21BA4
MSRPIFEKRRGDRPVQVRVSATGAASVAGTPVRPAPDEDIHDAVLSHLHHLATAHGTPIRATIHDDAAGCLIPLEISPDGTTRMTGTPTRLPAAPGTVQPPRGVFGPPPVMGGAPSVEAEPTSSAGGLGVAPVPPAASLSAAEPTPTPRSAPLGAPPAERIPGATRRSVNYTKSKPSSGPATTPGTKPGPELVLGPEPTPEAVPPSDPEPIPPSRFDAIAEEMLAEAPAAETPDGAEVWTAALGRVGDAVRDGQVERAAELASRAVAEASGTLGPRHPEVLHLRELCAYIAYLTGDPARAFDLSLDLARKRAEAGDPAAAYGNVRSAATAWRAVGDPEQALRMGRDLIDVWTALAAKPGPAAADPRPLESAHTRMTRLTARAAAADA